MDRFEVATIAPVSTIPAVVEWSTILSLAATLVKSGFLPTAIKTPEAAAAIILKGRELGIPPMQAFSHISVIQGKPTCSAELQLALLARGGVTWKIVRDGSDGTCEIEFRRPGFGNFVSKFGLEDAKRAGLEKNPSWTKYPAALCRARASSAGARVIGPDLLAGMSYTSEELGGSVIISEDGAVTPSEDHEAPNAPQPASGPAPATKPPQQAGSASPDTPIGEARAVKLVEYLRQQGFAQPHIMNAAKKHFQVDALADLTEDEGKTLVQHMKSTADTTKPATKPKPPLEMAHEPPAAADQGDSEDQAFAAAKDLEVDIGLRDVDLSDTIQKMLKHSVFDGDDGVLGAIRDAGDDRDALIDVARTMRDALIGRTDTAAVTA